ncbi:MAG: L-tyrosine/L-tryptophan isonitrile synthase family protein, partial [Candidatus Nanohaloarchaea archaeon]|nr:L-tyrosine/L-tryptophan isonitrile synthase family protein [Candidatus Nanohaloarchaea archaeon]
MADSRIKNFDSGKSSRECLTVGAVAIPLREESTEPTSERVTELFEDIRKKPEKDLWEEKGRASFKGQISNFIEEGSPVKFVLPAFPCKSPNDREKVL